MRRSLMAVFVTAMVLAACSSGGGGSRHGSSTPSTNPSTARTAAPSSAPGPSSGGSTTTRAGARVTVRDAGWKLASPVDREAVLTDGKDLIVLGGLNGSKTSTAAIVRINVATGTQTRVGTLTTPVHDAAGAAFGGAFYVLGGGNTATVSAVQVFALGNGTRVLGHLPEPRSDLAAAVSRGRVYVAGGYDGVHAVPGVLESTDGATFRALGALALPVRYPAMAALGDAVYVIGGETASGSTRAIQELDVSTGKVTVVAQLPQSLSDASAVVLRDHLYLVGGRVGGVVSDQVVRLDPATGATQVVGHLPAPLSDAAVAAIGDTAYVVGGEDAATSPTARVTIVTVG